MLGALQLMSPVLLLLGAQAAFESRWISGLHVVTESLSGQTAVNGVLFQVQRATGRDVPVVAERMLADWRGESGSDHVLLLPGIGWTVFSRIHQGESEVVQWRAAGEESELLWSSTNLGKTDRLLPRGTVPLPRGCHWQSPVHGMVNGSSFIQTSGSCPGTVPAVSTDFRQLLSGMGWTLHYGGKGLLQLEQGGRRAQIVLMPARSDAIRSAASDVVIVEVATRRGATP